MSEQKNYPSYDDAVIPLRKPESRPPDPDDSDISLPPPDDDRDIEFGMKILSAHSYEWKHLGASEEGERLRKKIIVSFIVFGIAVFLLLLLWFIASIMPHKGRHSSAFNDSCSHRICGRIESGPSVDSKCSYDEGTA